MGRLCRWLLETETRKTTSSFLKLFLGVACIISWGRYDKILPAGWLKQWEDFGGWKFKLEPLAGSHSPRPSDGCLLMAFIPGESLSFHKDTRPVGLGLPRGFHFTLTIFVELLSPDGVTAKAKSLMHTLWRPVQSIRSLRTSSVEIICQSLNTI